MLKHFYIVRSIGDRANGSTPFLCNVYACCIWVTFADTDVVYLSDMRVRILAYYPILNNIVFNEYGIFIHNI